MTDNFINKTFGLNVSLDNIPTRTIEEGAKSFTKRFEGLFNPFGEFFDHNRQVFNGDIYDEIKKYDLLCFNIGTQLRKADKTMPASFDTKA